MARHRRSSLRSRWPPPLAPVVVGAFVLAAIGYAASINLRLGAILLSAALAVLAVGLVALQQARLSQALEALADDSAAELDTLRRSMVERLDALQREFDGRVAQLAEVEQRLLAVQAETADLHRRMTTAEATTERLAAATLLPAFVQRAAQVAPGGEWADLWPDLADAPTVIDMIAWATPFADDDSADRGAAAAS